ncbi:substrate-binding domain-containing protein [Cohnella sp. CFH 77786]|uniref:LacI family DNA-binding transcriptional regulator n=1 Tax=Cohnella sp. CFH 77786 TaxID=2662265 RepID=UPI001C60DC33|nr:LacI family DNA-binding transcriptional regulator [Cohnella sp. CFH 77786]MBW5448650.1 substrate-binding domain-containing protein [Cohnella sp. CFH 77786]
MATNIRDVAKAAGVSVATVSKVLNGYTTVSQKTKEKVQRIVSETGFEPNAAARALVGQRSMTLGVFLTTGLTHSFFTNILAGMEQALKAKGYDLIYLAQLSYENKEYSFVRHCQSRNVEGVVGFGFLDDSNFDELIASRIPSVFIDLDVKGPRAGYISSDNVNGIARAVCYLRDLGHTRIALISDMPESYVGRLRLEGYRKGLRQAGLPDTEDYIAYGDYSRERGCAAMQTLLAKPAKPTAVVCCSDYAALGAIDAARDAGLSVPDDISVIGFDDLEIARNVRPALTTVRQDMLSIGRKSVELLDEMIQNPDCPAPAVIFPTELIIRETCAPPRE